MRGVSSIESIRETLRGWREENERHSQEIIDFWESTLSSQISSLGDESYVVYEQVCVAAFDCNRMDIADVCISELSQAFPGSLRVRRLKAMKLEALERYDDALDVLDVIIKKDETNAGPRKRKVAILKAQGKIVEAVKELTEYLKTFMADQEAWLELCDLYLSQQELGKAAFCMEEVLLHNPFNHVYFQRYAEIRYTQGGFENLEIARTYFCQAAKLNPSSLRALYGIVLTSSHILTSQKCQSNKKKECQKLAEWAAKQIAEVYSNCNQGNNSNQLALEGLMSSLQIS
nr:EOG090X0CGE [Triops cancriformis]